MYASRLVSIQRLLSSRYPDHGPGACIFILADEIPLLLMGKGYADVVAQLPITPATRFDLASISKHMTAYAILLLASQGKLRLEDEVTTYLPELSRLSPSSRPLRITDLLYHCSGLPDYVEELDEDDYLNFTNLRLLEWLVDQPLYFPTGTRGFCLREDRTTYCNTNYALLASIAERARGMSFPFLLRSELFDPLGMQDTFCDPWQTEHPDQARRYDRHGQLIPQSRLIPVYGDGNVFGTMLDLLRWDAELSHPKLLPSPWHERALQPGILDDGHITDYACGWYIRSWSGRRVVWHGGSWDGVSHCYSRWLDDRIRIVLLSNTQQHRACEVVSEIEEILLDD